MKYYTYHPGICSFKLTTKQTSFLLFSTKEHSFLEDNSATVQVLSLSTLLGFTLQLGNYTKYVFVYQSHVPIHGTNHDVHWPGHSHINFCWTVLSKGGKVQ